MRYILVDIPDRENFYPFTLTRSLADCRIGIFTFKERWEQFVKEEAGVFTANYLQILYANQPVLKTEEALFFINVTCIPSAELVQQINQLKEGEKLVSASGKWIATCSKERNLANILLAIYKPINYPSAQFINDPIHLLQLHGSFIKRDFDWIKENRQSVKPHATNKIIQEDQVFIEEGATVLCSNLNATEGPIYIGKEAVVMEGTSIRGPFVLGKKAVIKMNTSIYGTTSIGPYCLAGGEIKNSIIMGYSNKGHEGYLGDSIIGFWCNLGAGTCNSNIKNTAGAIQMWNESKQVWDTIGQKMGMLVGDYSRFAIQSSVNTGSYIGVSANIFGNGLLPKNIPNFTWGILPGYQFEKVIEDIQNWKKLKGSNITEEEQQILKHLHQLTA
jgi:UDP-N-acetylglucosamine diphosphorylase/glucosamine-1-phosphate N-acetyltransferase